MDKPGKDVSNEPVLERITKLLREQGKTDKELTEYLGITNGMFSKWRHNNGRSYFKYTNEIAEFLGVTSSYLLNGPEDVMQGNLTSQEIRLLKTYRELEPGSRDTLMEVTDRFRVAELADKLSIKE